jgi:RimJ/RimL family protein N-acetyltransferase
MTFTFQGNFINMRPFEPEDVPSLHEYLNHPELTERRYIPWEFSEVIPLSRKQVEEVYNHWTEAKKEIHLAVLLGEKQELIGHAECDWGWDPHCPSLSLVVSPLHQRMGYGSEVLHLLLRYLFEHMPAHTVSCWLADWNKAGRGFMKHHGFKESGRMRRVGVRQGRYFDFIVMDFLRHEWEERVKGGYHAA